jgi:hypothetical protein
LELPFLKAKSWHSLTEDLLCARNWFLSPEVLHRTPQAGSLVRLPSHLLPRAHGLLPRAVFSTWGSFALWRHLTVPRDILHCHKWERAAPGIWWVEAGLGSKSYMHRPAPCKEGSSQNVTGAMEPSSCGLQMIASLVWPNQVHVPDS